MNDTIQYFILESKKEMNFKMDIKSLNQLKQEIAKISQESSIFEKLAGYIEGNYKNVIFMTAGEIAVHANVSQASVSRFCSALGYHGYNDFLRNLQQFVREEITAAERLEYTAKDDSNINNILSMEHENIDELANLIKQPSYKELVKKLVEAKEIVLISARMSGTLLPYTFYILNKMRDGVTEVTPGTPKWDSVNLKNKKTTLIFAIVLPRYPNILVEKLKELKQEGFSIAAVTDKTISPITPLADTIISVPVTTSSIFDIYSTPILFLNLLLRDAAQKINNLNERLDKIEKYEQNNKVYFKTLSDRKE